MDNSHPVPGVLSLGRDAENQLVLVDSHGQRHSGVEAVRAFPISAPQHAVSICDADGRELAYVSSLAGLPEAMRKTLEIELSQREFVPVIRRILNNPLDTEPTEWEVETDRGVTMFQLEGEEDVHRSEANQLTVVDAHGIHYLIPDESLLDAHSRSVLDRYL
jgi:hypothetical protein